MTGFSSFARYFFLALLCVALVSIYPITLKLFGLMDPETVTVVVSAPMQLEGAKSSLKGITLAFEEFEYKAGDKRVFLSIRDNSSENGAFDIDKESQIAIDASADEATIAYIGPFQNDAAKVSMPILNKAGIVQISPTNTWPSLTKVGYVPGEPAVFYPTGERHYVRLVATEDIEAAAGAAWAQELGFKKVYVVGDADRGSAQLFASEAKKIGLTIVGEATITSAMDLHTLALGIVSSEADLLYFGGATGSSGVGLIRSLREINQSISFLGSHAVLNNTFIRSAGSAAEGTYVIGVSVPPNGSDTKNAKEFIRNYQRRYGEVPDVESALAYEAARVTLEAIARTKGTERKDVLTEVRSTRNYDGLFGRWAFDQNGDTSLTLLSGSVVKDGAFALSKLFEY